MYMCERWSKIYSVVTTVNIDISSAYIPSCSISERMKADGLRREYYVKTIIYLKKNVFS
jgi:hypothetical protein